MTTLAVLTPSYAPDFELLRDLNRSVLENTPSDVRHHVIVPERDRDLFVKLSGHRTEVSTVDQFIPRRMRTLPGARYHRSQFWLNLRRPFPPIRGWIMQQVVKLNAAVELGADLVLLADSDVELVRPVDVKTFSVEGRLRFYRAADAIDESLPGHMIWHQAARRLLGLTPSRLPPLHDYISSFNVWDRGTVAALRNRIEQVNDAPWLDVIASQPHFSEFILYGVFVDEFLGAAAEVSPTASMLCHSYWDREPLTAAGAREFLDGLRPDDVAVMINGKARTPMDIRRRSLAEVRLAIHSGP
jgi:hypothetical protein